MLFNSFFSDIVETMNQIEILKVFHLQTTNSKINFQENKKNYQPN